MPVHFFIPSLIIQIDSKRGHSLYIPWVTFGKKVHYLTSMKKMHAKFSGIMKFGKFCGFFYLKFCGFSQFCESYANFMQMRM